MVHSWWGLLLNVFATVRDEEEFGRGRRRRRRRGDKIKIAYILAAIQGLVFGIILCPLGFLYMLGLYHYKKPFNL